MSQESNAGGKKRIARYHDQDYLLRNQYQDGTNFGARVELSRRFSVNKYGWQRWIFDQLRISEAGCVLELGCGPGWLWLANRSRIPADWMITLSDFSSGMLQEARQRLGEERFSYEVVDAQAIPYPDASLDAVIANHMLYHVPDLPRALSEIRRVLKPGGRLYATTIGREHMREMSELARQALPEIPWRNFGEIAPFVLENGQELLAPFFASVALLTYEDALAVTEAEPLLAYALSGHANSLMQAENQAALRARIQQEIDAHGVLRITRASGMFVAVSIPKRIVNKK
jgi:SAM-dependent methyltransferase